LTLKLNIQHIYTFSYQTQHQISQSHASC
jgi:hypothetical protein